MSNQTRTNPKQHEIVLFETRKLFLLEFINILKSYSWKIHFGKKTFQNSSKLRKTKSEIFF